MNEDRLGEDLDFAGIQVRIDRTFLSVADFSAHFDHTFRFEFGKELGKFLILWVEHDLSLSFAVTQVQKEHASVVAQRVDPTD